MKRYIIHPLRQFIIRENSLIGFEGQIVLDKLNKDLSFYKTKKKTDHLKMNDFLESVRGTGKGRASIPKSGWIEVMAETGEPIEAVWKKAMDKLKEGDVFI